MSEQIPADPWARHAEQQRRGWLALTHAQRLAWLAQAKRFCAQALGAAREGRNVVAVRPGRNAPK